MSELKPCPFCGEIPELVLKDVEPQGDPWYGKKVERIVLCDCGICLFDEYFHEGFGNDERAVDAWNRRVPNPPLPEAENRGYRMGIKALLDAFSERIPKVQWLWMLQEEAEHLLKERKR